MKSQINYTQSLGNVIFLQKFLPATEKYRKRLQIILASKLTSGKNRCLREHSKFNAYSINAMKWYAFSKENISFKEKTSSVSLT